MVAPLTLWARHHRACGRHWQISTPDHKDPSRFRRQQVLSKTTTTTTLTTLGLVNSPWYQDGQQRVYRAVYARLFLHITPRQQPTRPLPVVRIASNHRDHDTPSTTRRLSSGPLALLLEHGAKMRPPLYDETCCQILGRACDCDRAPTADPWHESTQLNQEAMRALQNRSAEKGQERKRVPICHLQRKSKAQTASRVIGDCGQMIRKG